MVNAWVEHVKKWSKENGVSYACAVGNQSCKEEYYILKGEKPKAKAPKSKSENKHAGEPDGNSGLDIKHNSGRDINSGLDVKHNGGPDAKEEPSMEKEIAIAEAKLRAINEEYLQSLRNDILELNKQVDATNDKKEIRRLGKLIEKKQEKYSFEVDRLKNLKQFKHRYTKAELDYYKSRNVNPDLKRLKKELTDLEKQMDETESAREGAKLLKLVQAKRSEYIMESNKQKAINSKNSKK